MIGQTSKAKISGDQLLTCLEHRIVSGDWGEGERLPSERRLAEEFNVSRPVVREVLRGLSERDLVETSPGRGTYVREARMADAARPMGMLLRRNRMTPRDLVEARKMLECEAAKFAAKRATPADLQRMGWTLRKYGEARDVIEKTRYDLAFHTSIVHAAHNPILATMFGSISTLVAEHMIRSMSDGKVSGAADPYHDQIHAAIRDREPGLAARAVTSHLLVSKRFYGKDYDRGLKFLARREVERLFGPDAVLEELLAAATAASDSDSMQDDNNKIFFN